MHLFGDPAFPKKNLTAAAIVLALSASLGGASVERLILANAGALDYVFALIWAALFVAAVKMFRTSLSSVPTDRKK